jgi:hypothetical protein
MKVNRPGQGSRAAGAGMVLEHQRVIAHGSPSDRAFWQAIFGWAQSVPEVVLVDPVADEARIRHRVLAESEKRTRDGVNRVFGALMTLRHGTIRSTLQGLPLAFRPNWLLSARHLEAPLSVPTQLEEWSLAWRQGGRPAMLLTERKKWMVEGSAKLDPVAVRQLYDQFPSCSLVQEWFVRVGRRIPKVAGKPRTLRQLGALRNAELRRIVVATYGLTAAGAPLAKDDWGELYPVDAHTKAVHVTCPSTGREYWLGVPAQCQTPKQAVLWTFGLAETMPWSGRAWRNSWQHPRPTEEVVEAREVNLLAEA